MLCCHCWLFSLSDALPMQSYPSKVSWQCGCADICTAQRICFLPICFSTFFGGISWLTLWRCYFISCWMFILHTHRVPHFWLLQASRASPWRKFLFLLICYSSYYFACLFSSCRVPHFWSLLPVRPGGQFQVPHELLPVFVLFCFYKFVISELVDKLFCWSVLPATKQALKQTKNKTRDFKEKSL